jgi:hypothetical protein
MNRLIYSLGSIRSIIFSLEKSQDFRVDDARIRIIDSTVTADEQLRALTGGNLQIKLAAELDERINDNGDTDNVSIKPCDCPAELALLTPLQGQSERPEQCIHGRASATWTYESPSREYGRYPCSIGRPNEAEAMRSVRPGVSEETQGLSYLGQTIEPISGSR